MSAVAPTAPAALIRRRLRRRFSASVAIILVTLVTLVITPSAGTAQGGKPAAGNASAEMAVVPTLAAFADARPSELADVVARYRSDRSALGRRYGVEYSPARTKRLEEFTGQWLARLRDVSFDKLSQEGRVDYVLLRNELEYEQYQLKLDREQFTEMQGYTPFAAAVFD